jgi:hypothetical protein
MMKRSVWQLSLATIISAGLLGCGEADSPTEVEVDAYLESQLEPYFDVEDVKIESFIDASTKEGRVSVKGTVHPMETLYRVAEWGEIDAQLTQLGIGQQERGFFARGNDMPQFLQFVVGPNVPHPFSIDLSVKKQVDGWEFHNGRMVGVPQAVINAKPQSGFGATALPIVSDAGQAYFQNAVNKKQEAINGDVALIQGFEKLFKIGKATTINFSHPQSKRTFTVAFTADSSPAISSVYDGTNMFTQTGRVKIQAAEIPSLACSTSGRVTPTAAQISGKLERDSTGRGQPTYYTLEIDFLDPGTNKYCTGSVGYSQYHGGQVISVNNLYSWNWSTGN